MIGPLQDPNEECAMCGHTHEEHELGVCGCQLECRAKDDIAGSMEPCGCTDFAYNLDMILPGVKKE